jgi:hypothetical protein
MNTRSFSALPLILSIVVTMLVIAVMYAAERLPTTGTGKFSQYTASHDTAQLAAVGIALIGFVVIVNLTL